MTRAAEVLRLLDRYLIEVVERHDLCPWARASRERGELATSILWGTPTLDDWATAATRLLAAPATRVALVLAPDLSITRRDLGAIRDALALRLPSAGIAEFHPDAALDLTTPARLVPFLRRSPDPMLQLVPLSLLHAARAAHAAPALARQAAMLTDRAEPARDLTAEIASTNHATVTAHHAALTATLDSIAADRRGKPPR